MNISLCKILKLSNFGSVASDWKSCHKKLPVRKISQIVNITGGFLVVRLHKRTACDSRRLSPIFHIYIYIKFKVISLKALFS